MKLLMKVYIGDQMDMGWIKQQRGINQEKGFTEDGTGIWLNDKDGNPNPEPTQADARGGSQKSSRGVKDLLVVPESHSTSLPSFRSSIS